jgi:predicted phosphodiesterase
MGHQFNRLIILLMISSLTGCEKTDISGLFIASESVNLRFKQSIEWNALHPYSEISVPSEDYFILCMGDSHAGGTNNLNTFLNTAKTTNAAAVVMAGDLTTGKTSDYDVFQEYIPSQDSLPSFLMVGNHDLFYNSWNQFYSRFGSSTYIFTINTPAAKDLFICLDTGSGTLGNKQLDWLKEILQTSRNDYRYCVVFTHINFFRNRHTESTNPLVEELHVLMALFTMNQVDMVITGHDHKKYADKFGNTAYITMDALEDGLDYSGYFQLNVTDGNLDYTFINF